MKVESPQDIYPREDAEKCMKDEKINSLIRPYPLSSATTDHLII